MVKVAKPNTQILYKIKGGVAVDSLTHRLKFDKEKGQAQLPIPRVKQF